VSDQIPMGAPPPQAKASVFNPADAAMMGASGQFNPSSTVRDVLGKMGVDVDGPATQLVELFKSQMQNKTLTGKLGMGQPGATPFPQGQKPMVPPPQAPQGEAGGMEGLMRNLRA
jgi:hypothetical protein